MPLLDKRLPLGFPTPWLHRFEFSPLSRFATGMTARSIQSISSSSGTGSRWFISVIIACGADIVRAAIQEDVRAIGISSYNGGHVEFFVDVVDLLRKKGADDIKVFGGGGGTITHDDAAAMQAQRRRQDFLRRHVLDGMVEICPQRYGKPRAKRPRAKSSDQELAHKLTEIEDAYAMGAENVERRRSKSQIANRKSQMRRSSVSPGRAVRERRR